MFKTIISALIGGAVGAVAPNGGLPAHFDKATGYAALAGALLSVAHLWMDKPSTKPAPINSITGGAPITDMRQGHGGQGPQI